MFEDDHDQLGEIKFVYCTEFLIQNLYPGVTEEDVNTFRRKLNRIGDCVLVVGDLALVKVHVHTNEPGKALNYGVTLGELVNLKVENMIQQRRDKASEQQDKKNGPPKASGILTVSVGEGFDAIFHDLGVDQIVAGGQTMNPSIEDISGGIARINAKSVFVFPNNGNVILAAQQAAGLASDKHVYVIPTKNVAMGIAGIIAYQETASDEENVKNMEEAAQRVRTGTVTYAVRDSVIDKLKIKEGDILGLHNGKVDVKGSNPENVAKELMRKIVTEDDELITVYYGNDVTQEKAQTLTDDLAEQFADCDVEMHKGGQPLYYYLISVE